MASKKKDKSPTEIIDEIKNFVGTRVNDLLTDDAIKVFDELSEWTTDMCNALNSQRSGEL